MYSKEQRKTIRRHLQAALTILPDTNSGDHSPFICDCIRFQNWHVNGYDRTEFDITTNMISKRIEWEFGIDRWLSKQSNEIKKQVQYDWLNNRGRKLQAYRRAWLESLIKEFS